MNALKLNEFHKLLLKHGDTDAGRHGIPAWIYDYLQRPVAEAFDDLISWAYIEYRQGGVYVATKAGRERLRSTEGR